MATPLPPEDFRRLSVIPTREDIFPQERPFLRENKVIGRYDNIEHYLDVQFRLLREDFVRPLRDGIQQLVVMGDQRNNRKHRLDDIRVYDNVRILSPVFTSNGIAYKVRFDVSRFRGVQWENSKRLIFGSLLCLSKDKFKNFVFATVANRELRDIVKGEIEVRFVSAAGEAALRIGDMCQMAESIAFFEAYRPVLEGLQSMSYGKFPLQRYIVECEKDILPPAYLTNPDGELVKFDFSPIMSPDKRQGIQQLIVTRTFIQITDERSLRRRFGVAKSSSSVTVLSPASWPSAKDLELDDSQFEALQLALTKEFAVVQGPPGTGKTYIGLKIAKILLHNAKAWQKVSGKRPIFVVCYTNHALDQFLEGIHTFHKGGIVRVGRRSQSETMKECSLSNWKRKLGKRLLPKGSKKFEVEQEMRQVFNKISSNSKMLDNSTRTLIGVDELARSATSMKLEHFNSLQRNFSAATGKREPAVMLQYWLGLPVEPANPYENCFSKPLAMFPLNADCGGLEYFSQQNLAYISPNVLPASGADGIPKGSMELIGNHASFIEIANFDGGYVDAKTSITILAFVYPLGNCGPIITYETCGFGIQIWQEPVPPETLNYMNGIGMLTAWFVRRDLTLAIPIRKAVLNINAWNYIGVSYDYYTGIARLWHNGEEVEALLIGTGFELATQFPIRIGALNNPWQNCFFTGRISHLHIYSEALTVQNIQAVGYISEKEEGNLDEKIVNVGANEKIENGIAQYKDKDQDNENINGNGLVGDANGGAVTDWELQGINDGVERVSDVRFEAIVMQDQRILEDDLDVIRFDDKCSETETKMNSPDTTSASGCSRGGGWQFQNPSRIKQRIKQRIQRELKSEDVMSDEEANQVEDMWKLSEIDRWRLYRRWVYDAREKWHVNISELQELFDIKAAKLKRIKDEEDFRILSWADVIGMTTTGAARYHHVLQDIKPAITIVEEAAEVLEAHVVTSLTPGCQHLILIGDHQQLRPSPTVYDLQIEYNFDVSLFERMIKNDIQFSRLCLQHRMRPEIATMLDHIYVNPKLQNHESVLKFESIKGVQRNLFFVDHNTPEDFVPEGKSKKNKHEARFLAALCRYFIQQGYRRDQITILAAYSGQLFQLKQVMSNIAISKAKKFFEGVRVTVVDNFQGEENDIILLSLVRSDKIGFLKIANRVCVALSRARKGFFIIGNATLLARNSDLWRNIFADMQGQGSMGRELKLSCQNHPENTILASTPEDFEKAPEGGCSKPCEMKLTCGHICKHPCHPLDLEHNDQFACQQPCSKILCDLGHRCHKICGQPCGPCMEKVKKIIPECGHEQQVSCSQDPSTFKCTKMVLRKASCGHRCHTICGQPCGPCMQKVKKIIPECEHEQQVPCSQDPSAFKCTKMVLKKASSCGHINKVPCYKSPDDIVCKEPCGQLHCGHPCVGNCSKCQQGRFHLPCESKCSRILFCGHTCQDICVRGCPPCSLPCRNYCEHQKCKRSCGDPCEQCLDEYSWECPHQKLLVPCGEICANRTICEEPCQKKLPCGHSCIGVCGEKCPKLCRVCNEEADEFKENESRAMFIELNDCSHVFEVRKLDKWIEGPEFGLCETEEVEIKHKLCPKPECQTPILSSHRYRLAISKTLADFEAIKRRMLLQNVADREQIHKILVDGQDIKEFKTEALEITRSIKTNRSLTSEEVTKLQNQVTLLKALDTIHGLSTKDGHDLKLSEKLRHLKSRLVGSVHLSEQEIKEFGEEILRIRLLVSFKGFKNFLESKAVKLNPEDKSCVTCTQVALESGETIDRHKIQEFMADVNKLKQKYGLSKNVEDTGFDAELQKVNMKTRNLVNGPWYKCGKAHVYSAAERIEGEGVIKCPDCFAATTDHMTQQTQASSQVALSEMMAMASISKSSTDSRQVTRHRTTRPHRNSKPRK